MRKAFLIAFLALLAAVPLAQLLFGTAPPFRLLGIGHRAANLREFERRLDSESIFVNAARPSIQSLLFTLREAGEKVLAGADGTLYYRQDVRYLTEPVDTSEALAAILDTHAQLSAQGIRLIVMPVPVKPHRDGIRSAAQDLLPRLEAAGIGTIDLFSQPRAYLKLDTHWTPATAGAMARFAAARLGIAPGSESYAAHEVVVERRGDLAQMLTIAGAFSPEAVPASKVEGAVNDPSAAILVLGDSFLRIYETDAPRQAGFLSHLAKALARPVAAIVNDGGASTLVRQDLSRRPHLLDGKIIVLWEFVERDLRFGAEGWRKVRLR